MSFEIEIRPLAVSDILEAYDWYERQQYGLGLTFLNELDRFYAFVKQHPEIYSYYEKPVRQGKLNRFPFVVVYEVLNTAIVIYSVFMTRKDPQNKKG